MSSDEELKGYPVIPGNWEISKKIGPLYFEVGWFPDEGFRLFEISFGEKSPLNLDLFWMQVGYFHVVLSYEWN